MSKPEIAVAGESSAPASIVFAVELRTVSGLNVREHYMARSRRVKQEHGAVTVAMIQATRNVIPKPPLVISLTRIGPRKLDDDNLRASLKGCRDAIAAFLGIDDGSPLLHWEYAQRTGKRKYWAVEVRIESIGEKA